VFVNPTFVCRSGWHDLTSDWSRHPCCLFGTNELTFGELFAETDFFREVDLIMRAFLLATGLGMIPMTRPYVVVGANLSVEPWLAVTGGMLAIAMIFVFPRLAERYNLFHLQDVIRTHEDPEC
jgi:hypothetical protein